MQKEYAIQFYKTINKLLCNLSFAGQYTLFKLQTGNMVRYMLSGFYIRRAEY